MALKCCNGLQHFSAMLRDPRGGRAVNLTPSDKPQDIYQEVCDVLTRKLEVMGAKQTPDGRMARVWIQSELLDRKAVKRQVMTLPYGATRHGMHDMLMDHLTGIRDETQEDLPFEEVWDASLFLTALIYKSIGEVVVAAGTVMSWLQDCARIAALKGLPLRWSTPHGFDVVQAYRARDRMTVKTQICGNLRLVIRNDLATLARKKQSAGISPNFVHALDSCHMMETVAAMPSDVSWAVVHDSFGCHAADSALLARTLREQFVKLYEEHDVLAEFKADIEQDLGIKLPQPPPVGELDLKAVLNSPFFFA